MNRRSVIAFGATAFAFASIMVVAYGASSRSLTSSTRAAPPAGTGPVLAQRSGQGPISEVAVAPGFGAGRVPFPPTLPRILNQSKDGADGATSLPLVELQAELASFPMAPSLLATEREGLLWMREDERLARDVYVALARRWGTGPFAAMAGAKETHIEAVRLLIDRYGVGDPEPATMAGRYADPAIGLLHQELVTTGSASFVDGLKVGARIEERTIVDLLARASAHPDFAMVYAELERASRNHLRALVHQIERDGAHYAPTRLAQSVYDRIIGSGLEGRAIR